MNKESIMQIQKLLASVGCSPGSIDGIWGKQSQAALDKACEKYGIQSSFDSLIQQTQSGTFWDDIKYFTRSEFRCPCHRCGGFPAEPAEKLVRIADKIREKAGKPAHVSSGVRCIAHNAELPNSATNSRHLNGWAMDFCVDGMTATQLDALVGAQSGVAYHYKIDGRYVHMDVIL